MSYDFANLSPADFEDLVRDLIGHELNLRFEGFSAGPDGGVDGRHSTAGRSTILQAKHYSGSTFALLKSVMKRERAVIDRIRPEPRRYILATSRPITPKNKATLGKLIGPVLRRESDIFGPVDLNALIRKFPEIEKANIKLWLSGTGVLERLIRSPAHTFTAMSRAEIEAKVRVYAQNPSFKEARDKLEDTHVVIISGPPGVGKTTLAEMLAYAYIGEEWEFEAIRSLDDGYAAIKDAKKQIFFFDDFLGQVALDARGLSTKDSDLARFIRRVRKTPNARFILTTRAPVFEEARRVSEHLGSPSLDILKYVLDVGIYTRRIRARILYNHLFVTLTAKEHIRALWTKGAIQKIVDHKNYNPRIIEWMTDNLHTRDISAEQYPDAFIYALDNPHQLWDTSFRTHIAPRCRHLLFTLFFGAEYGTELDDLKQAFNPLHLAMCKVYNVAYDAKDFEESLRILESGYISISGTRVSFINPSLRDYLTSYLDDSGLLAIFASVAQKVEWAASLWRHTQTSKSISAEQRLIVARAFKGIAQSFNRLPVMKPDPREPNVWRLHDLALADRTELLLEWYAVTDDATFSDEAMMIAGEPNGGFSPWRDAPTFLKLVHSLRAGDNSDLPFAFDLSERIINSLVRMFEGHIWADDLERMYDTIEAERVVLGDAIYEAANDAVTRGVDSAMVFAAALDSKSTLEDELKALERLAPRVGIAQEKLGRALSEYKSRINEVENSTEDASPPSFSGKSIRKEDRFDDFALRDLFAPLLDSR